MQRRSGNVAGVDDDVFRRRRRGCRRESQVIEVAEDTRWSVCIEHKAPYLTALLQRHSGLDDRRPALPRAGIWYTHRSGDVRSIHLDVEGSAGTTGADASFDGVNTGGGHIDGVGEPL